MVHQSVLPPSPDTSDGAYSEQDNRYRKKENADRHRPAPWDINLPCTPADLRAIPFILEVNKARSPAFIARTSLLASMASFDSVPPLWLWASSTLWDGGDGRNRSMNTC